MTAEHSVVRRYYAAMDGGDLEGIAACFAEDAIFLLPGRPERGGELRMRRGRAEIVEFFRRRGEPRERHLLTALAGSGLNRLVEGVVVFEGEAGSQPFLAGVSLTEDGRIARYLVLTAPATAEVLEEWSEDPTRQATR